MDFHRFLLPPKGQIENYQIPPFPYDGLCFISLKSPAPFFYEMRCNDTDTNYSDKPILCGGRKELLPFGSYKGRTFSFDFRSKVEIRLDVRFEPRTFSMKDSNFREYTLDGLYWRAPIEIEAGREAEISLTNFRGGHYDVHQIYSPQHKGLSCKIKYHNQTIEDFDLENTYRFKRPWVFRWPDSAIICLKNEGTSKLEIQPNEIYFAGYLLKPIKVLEAIAPLNARNSFLIEGIVT